MKLLYHSKHQEFEDIWTFRFEPVDPVTWIAGQSIRLELPAGYGTEERRFSIVSAPFESDICITTRISESDFKQSLAALEPGSQIDAYSIEGDFVWADSQKNHVLGASGIGITAYIPMLKQLQYEHKTIHGTLLYANHDEHFIFDDLLASIDALQPHFTVERLPGRRLSADAIAQYCPGFTKSIVYLSGPSAMVDEVSPGLIAAGLPENNLVRDWFTGRPGWEKP